MGFALGIGTKDRGHLNRAVPAISILTLLSKPNSQLTAAYYYKAAAAIVDVRSGLLAFSRLALGRLRGPRGLGWVFGKHFAAQGSAFASKCRHRGLTG